MMSVADVVTIFSYFLGNPSADTGLCTLQGLVQQFGELSSIAWSTLIAYTLYSTVKRRIAYTFKHFPYYVLVGFIVPLLFALLPLTTQSYTNTGAWCWVDAGSVAGQLWRWLIFYGPLWGAIGFNGYSYYIARKEVRGARGSFSFFWLGPPPRPSFPNPPPLCFAPSLNPPSTPPPPCRPSTPP